VIGLAEAFGRAAITEGVETEEIGVRLLDLWCEMAQGYGGARPMPAEQLLSWATDRRPYHKWRNHRL